MFPDSSIAGKFQCGSRKTSYMVGFGLGQYFLNLIKDEVKGKQYVILFDESYNRHSKSNQMDFHVRYWSDYSRVTTRYLGSQFLGHSTAEDLKKMFEKEIEEKGLTIKDMVEISMDGPNVNWKFFEIIRQKLKDDFDTSLINIGSCGLHVIHNSFKTGAIATEWDIHGLLTSMYHLFRDWPARREDFTKVTKSTVFPLKFVSHKWLENVPVCDRALQVWEQMELFVTAVNEKKISRPVNKSYEVLKEAVKDPFVLAKLHFFKSVAQQLSPFLATYQTDKPLVVFLAGDLGNLVSSVMRRFIKDDIAAEQNLEKLTKIDIQDASLHKPVNKIEVGFQTEKVLKESLQLAQKKGKPVSERQLQEFRHQCKQFLIAMLQKILTKCPLSYSLVRNLCALDPREMLRDPDGCRTKFKKVLTVLSNSLRVKGDDCDCILNAFSEFLRLISSFGSDKFSGFSPSMQTVDEFLESHLKGDAFGELLKVVKLVLILSHGQATVERGFSTNKEIEVENLSARNLVAQRLICDHVKVLGGILNVDISKQLLSYVSSSRSRYEHHLEHQREMKKTSEEQRKRKSLLENIEELKGKQKRITDIESLTKSADELSEKAETTGNLQFLTKANSFRRTAKSKIVQAEAVESDLAAALTKLKKV